MLRGARVAEALCSGVSGSKEQTKLDPASCPAEATEGAGCPCAVNPFTEPVHAGEVPERWGQALIPEHCAFRGQDIDVAKDPCDPGLCMSTEGSRA